jgi:hypothetical protein
MGKAIADNTLAALDFMNKTFSYGTNTRGSANPTRTEQRKQQINILQKATQQEPNSRTAAINNYNTDAKKKKAQTTTGTNVKNSV